MSFLRQDILAAKERLTVGEPGVLVSVDATAGSTPREAGATMLVLADRIVGSVGGGTLEHRAVAKAREVLAGAATPDTETVPLGPAIGQCCGGSVTLRYEALNGRNLVPLDAWLDRLDAGITELWLFGAGHVGRAVLRAFEPLALRVTCIDSRPEFLSGISGESRTLASLAPHLEIASAPAGAMVLVMTHSHAQDFEIVDAALKRADLAFIGLIGSATKRARFLARLKARGHGEQALARLVCPIGIEGITSKQPAVIAASVAAQILRLHEGLLAECRPPAAMTG